MNRRSLLKAFAAAISSAPGLLASALFPSPAAADVRSASRIRPGDPAWPAQADWDRLSQAVGGRLVKVASRVRAAQRRLRAIVQGIEESLLPRRRGRTDPDAWLGRRLDFSAERLCDRR